MKRLVLILGDQCAPDIAALAEADRDRDVVVMAEVAEETTYAAHHVKKIAFVFSVMRHFAQSLADAGWTVEYTTLDDPDGSGSICGELMRHAERHGATEVIATEPGEFRLIEALENCPLSVTQIEDRRFLASHAAFERWAAGRKQLRMEHFYRQMRRRTGLLMDGDAPVEGRWNFDRDNRRPAPGAIAYSGPMRFEPDAITEAVLKLVADRFPDGFGALRPFWFAVTPGDARRHLARWIREALPSFGDYQDAMLKDERFLYHAVIGQYLNVGLLDPLETCQAVERAYKDGDAPINAAEGFIRQIIGWREYVRGVYWMKMPGYREMNALDQDAPLPGFYWTAETRMNCVRQVVEQIREEAYAHHIQRLMITGNLAMLLGVRPAEIHEWYLAVYADAFEWVELPNTLGMSQFADGGVLGSKPYAAGGNYISRMSDYCAGCAYDVKQKTGPQACPFNYLYWDFLDRKRGKLEGNHRLGRVYSTWDRMDDGRKDEIRADARTFRRNPA